MAIAYTVILPTSRLKL